MVGLFPGLGNLPNRFKLYFQTEGQVLLFKLVGFYTEHEIRKYRTTTKAWFDYCDEASPTKFREQQQLSMNQTFLP